MDFETQEFNNLLKDCYFHKTRQYPSEATRTTAYAAMEYLWSKCSLKVEDVVYSQEEIRNKLLYELMPEMLDRAIEVYMQAKNVHQETAYLAGCIFRTLLNYDAYMERMFRQRG